MRVGTAVDAETWKYVDLVLEASDRALRGNAVQF